jgi:hypothetical protein
MMKRLVCLCWLNPFIALLMLLLLFLILTFLSFLLRIRRAVWIRGLRHFAHL